MPRKPSKTRMYFHEGTEQAIVDYNATDDLASALREVINEDDIESSDAKNPDSNNNGEDVDPQRHINIVKNKLSGYHGIITCNLDYKTARYTA